MKILIDVLTPKQLLLFKILKRELEKRGNEVLLISRRYYEVEEAVKRFGGEVTYIGRHGGKELYSKLIAYGERVCEIARYVSEEGIDLAISFSSPETARVAFGLRIDHIAINDSPHAEAVARLTLPLSNLLFTPWIISEESWTSFGIAREKIVKYRALDPVAWIRRRKPSRGIYRELGLEEGEEYIGIREPEIWASYIGEKERRKTREVIRWIIENVEFKKVILPRYGIRSFIKGFEDRKDVIIPRKMVDGLSFTYFSKIFIGGGGTMTAEAALQGTPTISIFPGRPYEVEKFLIRKGLIMRIEAKKELKEAFNTLENQRKEIAERASQLLRYMEDPIRKIVDTLSEYYDL